MDSAEDRRLSTHASTTEGILYWAFRVISTPSCPSASLEPDARGNGRTNEAEVRGDASYVIRAVDSLDPLLRHFVRATFGADRLSEIEIIIPLCREIGQTHRSMEIARLVIRDWTGEERVFAHTLGQKYGYTRQRAQDILSTMRSRLSTWNEMATRNLTQIFREKGWLE